MKIARGNASETRMEYNIEISSMLCTLLKGSKVYLSHINETMIFVCIAFGETMRHDLLK